ncbi:hypothetical protein NMG60_11016295 [Bertholletia excelsa]
MRKLFPNFDNEGGLDTVLEVPIPEEMFANMGHNAALRWDNMRAWMRAQRLVSYPHSNHFLPLLKLVGFPLIPFPSKTDHALSLPVHLGSIQASTAKYIVAQYIAATGGHEALNSLNSMYAVGQVKVVSSDIHENSENLNTNRISEVGGFVVWQKNSNLWFLELVVSSCKVNAGSDGKMAWSQSSCHPSQPSKGAPRPLRRLFQGLDPKSTANLFLNAACIGEKKINREPCFILKLETSTETLRSQSTINTEIIHHTVWGYFSQRTGLLVQFQDSKLVRIKTPRGDDSVFWETTMESQIEDYRYVEGVNIAHAGKTMATIYRYGRKLNHRVRIEESWRIEEVDFNICGLSMDCFLPPADVKEREGDESCFS